MAKNGIDLSDWQADLNLDNISYDFVGIKATEGTGYVNPSCDVHYQEAKVAGKKRWVYHFTNFGDPTAEADYFAANTNGYRRDCIPTLDWEGAGVGAVQDALAWLRRVRDHYGYNPAIYMSEWVENHYDWSPVVAEDFGLIIAKYSDYEIDNNYDMSGAGTPPNVTHWPFYFMWQWTSKGHLNGYAGDLDCDIAYLTDEQWDRYAGVLPPQPTTTTTTTTIAPTTTTTTTVPPAPITPSQPSTTTTTTTTAVLPTSHDESGTTTTTSTTMPGPEAQKATIWGVVVAVLIAILKRLQGVQ